MRSIDVTDGIVRVADIAFGGMHGNLVVARLPRGQSAVELDEDARRSLLRSRLPGSALTLRHDGPLRIRKLARGSTPPASQLCYITSADIPAGVFLSPADVEQVPCDASRQSRRLVHERLGPAAHTAPYARAEIPAGSNLGPVRIPEIAPVAAGSKAVFRTSEGPVVIEREVVTLQSARPGDSLFVKTGDGDVIVSRLTDDADRVTP